MTVATTISTSQSNVGTAPPTKIIAAAITTSSNGALTAALKEQNGAQTAHINKIFTALAGGGDGRRVGGRCGQGGNKTRRVRYALTETKCS